MATLIHEHQHDGQQDVHHQARGARAVLAEPVTGT